MSKEEKKLSGIIWIYLTAIAFAMVVAVFIRMFLFEAYKIPNSVMVPTLQKGETIFVSKIAYSTDKFPQRGDVVLYSSPEDSNKLFIRRIVAQGGDTIAVKNGMVYLNEKNIAERESENDLCGIERPNEYKAYAVCWEPPIISNQEEMLVPENTYYMLGDMRSQLNDIETKENFNRSALGLVPLESILGKASWIWLSMESQKMQPDGLFSKLRFNRMFNKIE